MSDAPRQGRSTTPSSNGSTQSQNQRSIMTGLQDAVQEYLKAPPVNTLPHPEFPMAGPSQLNLSAQLEEGMCQMSDVIAGMSDQALSDQGSQESPAKNAWKSLKKGETATLSGPLPYTDRSGITETGRRDLTQRNH